MRAIRVKAILVITAALAACRGEQQATSVDRAALSAECSPGHVDWSSSASNTGKVCSGGFEYQSRCCDHGYSACAHTHKFIDYSETFTVYGTNCFRNPPSLVLNSVVCNFRPCDANQPEVADILRRVKERRAAIIASGARIAADPTFNENTEPYVLAVGGASGSTFANWGGDTGTLQKMLWARTTPLPAYRYCTVTIRGAVVPHDTSPAMEAEYISSGRVVAKRRVYDGGATVNPPGIGASYDAMCGPRTYAACDLEGTNPDGSRRAYVSSATFCPSLPKMYTAPGTTLAEFLDPATSGVVPTARTFSNGADAWRCMTGENLGAGAGDAYWQAKWTQMQAQLANMPAEGGPPFSPRPGTKRSFVQHMQLVFELYGDKLTPGQRDEAEKLYQLWDSANGVHITASDGVYFPGGVSCGARPWMNYQACATQAGGTQVMCSRILGNLATPGFDGHVPLAVANAVVPKCASLGTAVQGLASTCPAAYTPAATEFARASTELMRAAFGSIPGAADAAGRTTALRRNLGLTEVWYTAMKSLEADRASRFRDAEVVAGAIVGSVSAHRTLGLDAATDTAARDAYLLQGAADQQELLRILLPMDGMAPPLKNAPALYVLAEALRPHADRLNEADYLHDFGCRFTGCTSTGGRLQTKTSQMHDALGRLAEPTALTTVFQATSQLAVAWRNTFDAARANFQTVFAPAALDAKPASWTSTAYDPSLVLDATAADGPLWTMLSLVQPSKEKHAHYQATGRFHPGDANALYTGLTANKLDEWLGVTEELRADVKAGQSDYTTSWIGMIDALARIQSNEEREANARGQLLLKLTQLQQYADRIDGLRVAATVDLERFGDFVKAYDDLVAVLDRAPVKQYVEMNSEVRNVTPGHARYGRFTVVHNPADVAAQWDGQTWSMQVQSGDILRVEVGTGDQWSPTCAIAAERSFDPPLTGFDGAMTGPQGFGLTVSNSSYTARTTTEKDFNAADYAGLGGAIVGGIIGGVSSGGAGSGAGASIGGQIGTALGGLFGGNKQSSTTTGTETRRTAAFNAGLRVTTTPYKEFPAGSLLLALVDNSNGKVHDIQVVQAPYTALVIPSDVTDLRNPKTRSMSAYLIVNDSTCTRGANVGQLGVEVKRMRPLSAFARALQPAMAAAAGYVRDQVEKKLLPQGVILPSDLGTIRSQAIDFLQQQADYADLSMLNGSGLQLFNAWIDTELNQAERQVEIARLQRETIILALEAEALARDIELIGRQAQLLALLPAWSINSIDQTAVKGQLRNLTESVDRFLVPFARAKYPEVLQSLRTNTTLFAPITSNLDWSADWASISKAMADDGRIVDSVMSQFRTARAQYDVDGLRNPLATTIAVAIPKPRSFWNEANGEAAAMRALPAKYSGLTGTPIYRELSPWDSEQVWSAITMGRHAKIQIPPDLLYRVTNEAGVSGTLPCDFSNPVIQHMAIFAADTGLNVSSNAGQARTVVTHASESQLYGTPGGLVAFTGDMPSWLRFSTPIYWGKDASAWDLVVSCTDGRAGATTTCPGESPARYMAGNGLSPFSTFTLAPDTANLLKQQVYALILMMRVEYRRDTTGVPPRWIERCR